MATTHKNHDVGAQQVENALRPLFPSVEAYRYNPASIRVRVIDERFRDKSKAERDAMVAPYLKELPPQVRDDVTLLLLLTEDEKYQSMMNTEFEHPRRSAL
jgi:stress-induced morphogen